MRSPDVGPRAAAFAAFAALVVLTPLAAGAQTPSHPEDALRNRLEAARATGHLTAAGRTLLARQALPDFYLRRAYRLAWVVDGRLTPAASEVLDALGSADAHGLQPTDYHVVEIRALRDALGRGEPGAGLDLELLLTDGALVYGSHLLLGAVNPEAVDPEWLANRREADMASVLEGALTSGGAAAALERLAPRQRGYERLRSRLAELRAVAAAGGWQTIPPGETLRPGESSPRVPALRHRLAASGDLAGAALAPSGSPADVDLFDEPLEAAVRRFQARHGLEVDGVVGQGTLAALNIPVAIRLQQVTANLERWRWLPDDLGRRHIRVNIAAFVTEVWHHGDVTLRLRSVVGREYRKTPVFSGTMSYLVLAPFWHVPPTIAAVDKLPLLKEDAGSYLAAQKMTLLDAASNRPVDPSSVPWADLTGARFNAVYRLRQDPGPLNALGRVKFMFPNRHNVYLHDTPSRELFARARRDFSSGCIRIENPLDLASLLLASDPQWSPERIRGVADGGREVTITLPEPLSVHLLYWTAFVDDDGVVNFRDDVYSRDATVLRALAAGPPPGP